MADENFLSASRIVLFGKVFSGLKVDTRALGRPATPATTAVKDLVDKNDVVARIFSFSYEGHYQKLAWPMLFLVNGDGQEPYSNPSIELTGIEAGLAGTFSKDIRAWSVDRHDVAICLDLLVGKFDELLLSAGQDDASGRSAMASRSAAAFRSASASRSAVTFRSAMIGPHQDR